MRNDMSKIVSKPKESHRYVQRPGRTQRDLELLPTREPMNAVRYHRVGVKNAGPLLRWMRAQVGRRWSTVYAELAGRFDARTAAGFSMRDFLDCYVYQSVHEVDGELKALSSWGGMVDIRTDLYVDPKTGLLQRGKVSQTPRAKTRMEREKMAAERDAKRIIVSKTRQLHLLDGTWYWVDLAPITPAKRHQPAPIEMSDGSIYQPREEVIYETVCRDILSGHSFEDVPTKYTYGSSSLRDQYGTIEMYGVRKHQASHADIRKHVQ
jgi:hypothetical protein